MFNRVFIFFILLTCCAKQKEYQEVTVKDKYSISLPFDVKPLSINKEASLQYGNSVNEFYIMVLDEPKEEFYNIADSLGYKKNLDTYFTILDDNYYQALDGKRISEIVDKKEGHLKTKSFKITGIIQGYPIVFRNKLVEGRKRLYQISVWTRANEKDKIQNKMKEILKSFKEI